jgi:hypothetical protein
MNTQQLLELLLARMETMQVKADADREERKADRRELKEMMMKLMDTSHKEMVAEQKPERDMETMACRETMEAHLEEEEMMACQEMEARPEEKPTSVDRKPEAAEEEEWVPKEDAEVMPVRELKKKQRKDRNQQNMKKRTQGMDGCQRRLAAAHRGTSHHAEVARKMQSDKKMPHRATVA